MEEKRRQEYMEMKEYRYYMKNMKDVFEILMTKGNPKCRIAYNNLLNLFDISKLISPIKK